MQAQLVPVGDGRVLEVHEHGDPTGFPVVFHHGSPGSGLAYEWWLSPGVRLIGFDRPGYGGSTRNRGRTISSSAADVEVVADALELDRTPASPTASSTAPTAGSTTISGWWPRGGSSLRRSRGRS
jgi:pimeloyl-ACP methyl ester carboxylesterase